MGSAESLEYSIDGVVKHYSSLFSLPSHGMIALLTFLTCLVGGFLAVPLLNVSLSLGARFSVALQFVLLLFLMSTISDFIIRQLFLRSDPVYNQRRCSSLSMLSNLLWFGFLLLGSLLALLLNSIFWVYLLSMGFATVCILRLITVSSTSVAPYWRVVIASLIQPLLCLFPMFYATYSMDYALRTGSVLFLFFSIPISIVTAFLFLSLVDSVGLEAFQTPTTSILKAFLVNWMEDINYPLEGLFESLGSEKTIDFSLLAFKAGKSFESLIVVSSFHPGPFRNVGSSLLPFMIQEALEKKLGCVVGVPHGLFGHEFDLSSQEQNKKVLTEILESTSFEDFDSKATRFVRTQKDVAGASCQIFGDCAILIMTLAPETTEDFPKELGDFILEEAAKLGLGHVVVVNAHNSIDSAFDIGSVMAPLKEAALAAMREASKQESLPFEVGAAKVVPREFRLEDGMGPGGICALVVRVDGHTGCYVVVDGNNMVSGLREEILEALKKVGVDEAEVLTTDTHVVNAVTMIPRGYHPIGEAIPHEKIISDIKRAAREALDRLKSARVAWRVGRVPNVGVIGEKQIRDMSKLADKALSRARRTAVPLFGAAGLALLALLLLL